MADISTAPPAHELTRRLSITSTGDEVPREPINPFEQLCMKLHRQILAFLDEDAPTDVLKKVQEQTRVSLSVISQALDEYRLEELSLSYNGGKDCLVLLILFLASLHSKRHTHNRTYSPVQCVYIQAPHPFAEVEKFVASSSETYSLTLDTYNAPMKAAFAEYLKDKPSVKAIFVGTRRTDPHGENLTNFDPTDHGWPEFMRVHPVIDWHYTEIWTFIRRLEIPYCPLYDRGYTSLGGTNDTHPNPALQIEENKGQYGKPQYRPAYELVLDGEERLGRDSESSDV